MRRRVSSTLRVDTKPVLEVSIMEQYTLDFTSGDSPVMKECGRCHNSFPATLEYFHKESRKHDGLRTVCKSCQCVSNQKYESTLTGKQRKTEWRQQNPAKVKGYNQKYRAIHPGQETQYSRKWRKENPEKARAHNLLWKAIMRGDIVQQHCSRCGREDAHAHHYDYNRPLDVLWLCPGCHSQEHVRLRKEQIEQGETTDI